MTREQDRQVFHQAQALFWMLCATDGHAKNFSFFIRPGGALSAHAAVRRAVGVSGAGRRPVEDLAAQGQAGHGGAEQERSLEGVGHPAQALAGLGTRHGVVTADGRPAQEVVDDLVARTPEALAQVRAQLPHGFPADVADSILEGVEGAAARLAA